MPIGMHYRTSSYSSGKWDVYWFERNLHGDVVAIYNNSNTKLASYLYDAWGNHTVTYHNGGGSLTAIVNNPIRYRGYYYDIDLGLYYLQTRYYDSNIGRFINADDVTNLGVDQNLISYNLYAYCSNNPVMFTDPSGEGILGWAIFILASAVIGGVVGGLVGNSKEDDEISIIGGVISGALILSAGAGIVTVLSGVTIALLGLGADGLRIVALGALSYNAFAILLAPFLNIEIEPIEINPSQSHTKPIPQNYKHPAIP